MMIPGISQSFCTSQKHKEILNNNKTPKILMLTNSCLASNLINSNYKIKTLAMLANSI